jgi:hypothetical protein
LGPNPPETYKERLPTQATWRQRDVY